jgi:hypothetical protein
MPASVHVAVETAAKILGVGVVDHTPFSEVRRIVMNDPRPSTGTFRSLRPARFVVDFQLLVV